MFSKPSRSRIFTGEVENPGSKTRCVGSSKPLLSWDSLHDPTRPVSAAVLKVSKLTGNLCFVIEGGGGLLSKSSYVIVKTDGGSGCVPPSPRLVLP